MKGLRIDEASGVDAPAHLAPGWMVMKSAEVPGTVLTVEDLEALIKAEEANQGEAVDELLANLTKALGTMPDAAKAQATALIAALGGDPAKNAADGDDPVAKAVAEALTKANADREAAEARAKTAEDALAKARDGVLGTGAAGQATEEEALAKALESMPEPVRKAWVEGQERIAKAETAAADAVKKAETERDARVSSEYLAKAKGNDYANLPAAPETRATILREVDEKLSKEAGAELHRILKAASHLAAGGAADFAEFGGAGADATNPAAALETAADELQKADPKLDRPSAILKAADLNPDLAASYQKEIS
jgi:hypothetical protein